MKKMDADVLRSVAASSLTTSYAALGGALEKVWVMMVIKNNTNGTIFVSENGSDDHYELPAGTAESYDFMANIQDEIYAGKAVGTQFQVKADATATPTLGKVILQGQYHER